MRATESGVSIATQPAAFAAEVRFESLAAGSAIPFVSATLTGVPVPVLELPLEVITVTATAATTITASRPPTARLQPALAALALAARLLLRHPPLAGFFLLLLTRGHGRSNATEKLRNNAPNEQDSDDERRDTAPERDQRGEQPQANLAGVHQPSAWSTTSAVNGAPPGGVIWYERPHLPTITSAGADRE